MTSDEGRVSARRAQTRRRLLDAASATFADVGVEAASVEQICERAGFTRGAFYSNFSSKDELCIALLAEQRDAVHASAGPALASALRSQGRPEAASDPLGSLISAAVATFVGSQRTDRLWVLASNELRLHAARNAAVGEAYRAFTDELTALFQEVLGDALAATGHQFSVPLAQAVDMLHAVWELSLLTGLIHGSQAEGADLPHNLETLVRAMIVPVA